MNSPLRFLAVATVLLVSVIPTASLGVDDPQRDDQIAADINPKWLVVAREEADQQYQLLMTAYQLDGAQQAELRQELDRLVAEQARFEPVMAAEVDALAREIAANQAQGIDVDTPEANAATVARLGSMVDLAPLNERVVATALEARLPPDAAASGRARIEELWYRRERIMEVEEEEIGYNASIKKSLIDASLARKAPQSPAGNPLPHERPDLPQAEPTTGAQMPVVDTARQPLPPTAGLDTGPERPAAPPGTAADFTAKGATPPIEKTRPPGTPASAIPPGDHKSPEQPAAPPAVGPPRKPSQPERFDATRPPAETGVRGAPGEHGPLARTGERGPLARTEKLPPAPELDEWDKYVDQTAKKYGFDDPQKTKSGAILRDLRRRAEQYRLSRSNEYTQTRQMTDAKARAEAYKKLNQPLDALFEELKQRLDSLATAQQKARAKTAEAPKKK